jgi:DNA methyltransferase 1-associated protein 1
LTRLPSFLPDDDWTQAETTYLFSLLRTYDLRFVIAADRYDFEGGPKRSIEDIKSRYYSVCRRLVRTRPTGDEAGKMSMLQHYAFDRGGWCLSLSLSLSPC